MFAIPPQARRLREQADWLLIVSCVLALTTQVLVVVPMSVMAVLGCWRLYRAPRAVMADPAVRILFALFAALWLPMLLALPDAVNPQRSLQTVLPYPRFFLAGLFTLQVLRNRDKLRSTMLGVFVIVSFWSCDAMVQFFARRDLLGYPHDVLQLSGMFYPKLRLGIMTALLLPLFLAGLAAAAGRRRWPYVLVLPVLAAIVLSSSRNAWFLSAVASLGYGAALLVTGRRLPWRRLGLSLGAAILFVGAIFLNYQPLQQRVTLTASIFEGDSEVFDRVSGYRLSLWRTAAAIAQTHWLNGIGPRGFRYAYEDYAREGEFWMQAGRSPTTHPHQQLLEIAAECGLIGIAGFVILWMILLRLFLRSSDPAGACPWLIAAALAVFPANAHLAFYGSYWSAVVWWLLPIAVAAATWNQKLGSE